MIKEAVKRPNWGYKNYTIHGESTAAENEEDE